MKKAGSWPASALGTQLLDEEVRYPMCSTVGRSAGADSREQTNADRKLQLIARLRRRWMTRLEATMD
jgi:hypothetical protein